MSHSTLVSRPASPFQGAIAPARSSRSGIRKAAILVLFATGALGIGAALRLWTLPALDIPTGERSGCVVPTCGR